MTEDDRIREIKIRIWESSIHLFGTYKIFDRRLRILKRFSKFKDFSGIALTIITVFAFKILTGEWQKRFFVFIGVLTAVQGLLSVWSLVSRWTDEIAISKTSSSKNFLLYRKAKQLAESNDSLDELQEKFSKIQEEDNQQSVNDLSQAISPKEIRYGMRSALFDFRKECASCCIQPKNMQPTDCDTCGNFPRIMTW